MAVSRLYIWGCASEGGGLSSARQACASEPRDGEPRWLATISCDV